jgi:hypothetical protein
MRTVRIGLIGAGFALLLLAAGCTPGAGSPTGASPTNTTTVGQTTAPASAPVPSPTAAHTPAGATPAAPTLPAAGPPPVDIAIITAFTATSVSWTDGKIVPAETNNTVIEPLSGAAHKHSAPLSPNIRYYTFDGPNGVTLDEYGAGAVPCDRQTEASLVLDHTLAAPRLTFDNQGRILTMAAHFHP